MTAYYNEHDPFAAAWLRNLIAAGLIAKGEVDERDIRDVRPRDLDGFAQCHFFAGIGVWSYALRNSGWSDSRPVWTGSCPCQPFSAAGQRKGAADERHLWPAFFHLIRECGPDTIFGEQVASKDGLAWFDLVSTDLEGADYAVGACDTCAAGVGAPHIRQRLYFVADSQYAERWAKHQKHNDAHRRNGSGRGGNPRKLAIPDGGNASTEGIQRSGEHGQQPEDSFVDRAVVNTESEQMGLSGCSRQPRTASELGDTGNEGLSQRERDGRVQREEMGSSEREALIGAGHSFWSDCDWLPCIDGKARPVEPGTFPLAHGVANRVGLLRGYGNSLVAPQAEAFIASYMELC